MSQTGSQGSLPPPEPPQLQAPPPKKRRMHENEAQEQRAAAAGAWARTALRFCQLSDKQLVSAAVVEFLLKYPERQTQAARRMVKDAEQRLMADEGLQNKPHPGRPRLVSDDAAYECVRAFERGVGTFSYDIRQGHWYGFTSIDDAAENSPLIRATIAKFNCTPETVWSAMTASKQRHGEKWNKISIQVKPALSQKTKDLRVKVAREWDECSTDDIYTWVFLDEKKAIMKSFVHKCYAPPGVRSFQVEAHETLSEMIRTKVCYIGAVCAACGGAVYFEATSGTTGLYTGYRVRTSVPSARNKYPPNVCRSCLCLSPSSCDERQRFVEVGTRQARHLVAQRCCVLAELSVLCCLFAGTLTASTSTGIESCLMPFPVYEEQ
jgi:hypothetical protein